MLSKQSNFAGGAVFGNHHGEIRASGEGSGFFPAGMVARVKPGVRPNNRWDCQQLPASHQSKIRPDGTEVPACMDRIVAAPL
jgi:hypothetical protein